MLIVVCSQVNNDVWNSKFQLCMLANTAEHLFLLSVKLLSYFCFNELVSNFITDSTLSKVDQDQVKLNNEISWFTLQVLVVIANL
jgi:hypothetical protein